MESQARVLHAVGPELLPLPGRGQCDGVASGPGLALEAVGGEQRVEGEGGVDRQFARLENVEGLENPPLGTPRGDAPGGVEERDVETDAVERAEARGGVQEGHEALGGVQVGLGVGLDALEEEGLLDGVAKGVQAVHAGRGHVALGWVEAGGFDVEGK